MLDMLEEKISIWQRLQTAGKPLVIYGMGDGAEKLLAACLQYQIKIAGVFASDGFVRGHSFKGFEVKTLATTKEELGEVIILLAFATHRPEVLALIDEIANENELYAPDLPVYGRELFTMDFLAEYQSRAEEVYTLLADNFSKQLFLDILNYKISGKISYLKKHQTRQTEREELWHSLIKLSQDEVYLDAGAYNGDTVEEFVQLTAGRYKSIIAIEPDRRNFKKLVARVEAQGFTNVKCHQLGVWSGRESLNFAHKSGRHAAIDDGGVLTKLDSIDNIVCQKDPPTIIKYDVEGAETEALLGSEKTIRAHHPRLIVSGYHRSGDIFELPLLIKKLGKEYNIYLRRGEYIPAWDLNILATTD